MTLHGTGEIHDDYLHVLQHDQTLSTSTPYKFMIPLLSRNFINFHSLDLSLLSHGGTAFVCQYSYAEPFRPSTAKGNTPFFRPVCPE